MTDHVHVYDMRGRCIRSAPMRDLPSPYDAAADAGVPAGLRYTLLDMGLVLKDWAKDEQAGLASAIRSRDDKHIVRIKPTGLMRDMRSTTDVLEAIRKGGVEISLMGAWELEGSEGDADPAQAA